MRGLLFGLLRWYRARARRRMLTAAAEDAAVRRILSGQTWDAFCDELKAAGASISGFGAPTDPTTQLEGYRYLSRLLRAGLEAFVEYRDPAAPELRRMVHETVKMGADNPDNLYFNASISADYEYRLVGSRGSVRLLTFSTQSGGYGEGAGLPPSGALSSEELEVDDDGRFEIILSRRAHEKNWLPMTEETGLLIVRQTFLDRKNETAAEIRIERIDQQGRPAPMRAAEFEAGLGQASAFVAGASMMFARWAKEFQGHKNELPLFDPDRSTKAGGDPNITYYHSCWELGPDEALVIDAEPPECLHWNFQLNNHWMESLDYRFHRIHINKHTAQRNEDGSVRVVVAHQDPGHPNWLSTTGHTRGTMCWRWIYPKARPQPRCRVVRFAELADLPELS